MSGLYDRQKNMKSIITLLLVAVSLSYGKEIDITGYWASKPTGGITQFKADGTFKGAGFGQSNRIRKGKYEFLEDGTGFITYYDSTPILFDLRELTEKRMVLAHAFSVVVFEKVESPEAIQALEKSPKEKIETRCMSNLRYIVSFSEQFMLENGKDSVSYPEFVAAGYKPAVPIDGESYDDITIYAKGGVAFVTTKSGRAFKFTYDGFK